MADELFPTTLLAATAIAAAVVAGVAVRFLRRSAPPSADAANDEGTPWFMREPETESPSDETVASAAAVGTNAAPKKPKRSKKKASGAGDEARANLPEIPVGTKCWHRQVREECVVLKVYYDDLPPYYAVRMADGTERSTVRARLETADERAAAAAEEAKREAELKAEAAAAELLAEEARSVQRRRPTSEGKGERGAKAKKR